MSHSLHTLGHNWLSILGIYDNDLGRQSVTLTLTLSGKHKVLCVCVCARACVPVSVCVARVHVMAALILEFPK